MQVVGGAHLAHGALDAITCTTSTSCLAVGANDEEAAVVSVTTDGGQTWTTSSVPSGLTTLQAVQCSNPTDCVAGGKGGLIWSSDAGQTWSQAVLPVANATVLSFSCPQSMVCVAAGVSPTITGPYSGVLMRSTDGGETWSTDTVATNTPGIGSIACPTSTHCVAVGATILVSNDGGVSWSIGTVAGGTQGLRSIACTTATHCVAIGTNLPGMNSATASADVFVTNDGGMTWQPESFPAGTANFDGITCTGTTQCYAFGAPSSATTATAAGVIVSSTDGGDTWATAPAAGALTTVADLYCATASQCIAIGLNKTTPATAMTGPSSSTNPQPTQVSS
jgi:photosystem II stability/assembly factor-like uncharacterized protein